MGYGRLRAPTPPVRNGGEAGKEGRGGITTVCSRNKLARRVWQQNSGKRPEGANPAGFWGQPPFPMDAARGAGSGCAGGALTLHLSPVSPEYRSFSSPLAPAPPGCAEGLTDGSERGMALECGPGSAAGTDGQPSGTHGHSCAPMPGSPAGCPEEGGGGGREWPRTSLPILYAPAVFQRAEETRIGTERLSQGLPRPCPLVPSARRQKSPRAIPCISLQPQQLPCVTAPHALLGTGVCECHWQQLRRRKGTADVTHIRTSLGY